VSEEGSDRSLPSCSLGRRRPIGRPDREAYERWAPRSTGHTEVRQNANMAWQPPCLEGAANGRTSVATGVSAGGSAYGLGSFSTPEPLATFWVVAYSGSRGLLPGVLEARHLTVRCCRVTGSLLVRPTSPRIRINLGFTGLLRGPISRCEG